MNLLLLVNASRKSTALCTAERAILSGSRKKGLRHYAEITATLSTRERAASNVNILTEHCVRRILLEDLYILAN